MDRFYVLHLCLLIVALLSFVISMDMPMIPNMNTMDNIQFKGKVVSPCVACQNLVKSFLTAVEETTRKGFAGGDADWERQKLGIYENSELRFIEIQEMLCSDTEYGKDQCYNLAELYESELEDWFYEKRNKNVDLHESLCINHLKVCCPNNTYGPKCVPCPGGIEKPCGGHGECTKAGTKEMPATCFCDIGYAGELCDQCAKGYYQELPVTTLSCTMCDKACKDHCRGPGPKNCEVCAFGFHFVPNDGCVEDFDEPKTTVKTLNESESENETESSDEAKASGKTMKNNPEELNIETNLEDSTVDVPHSEL